MGVKASGNSDACERGEPDGEVSGVGPWPVADGACLDEWKGSCNQDMPKVYLGHVIIST